jgi:hypothetical protein
VSHLAVVTLAVSWRGNDVCGVHKKIGGTHEIPFHLHLHQGRRIHSQLVKFVSIRMLVKNDKLDRLS